MSDGGALILVGLVAGWLGLAYVPARIAASKGRSFVGFYIAGLFCFFPALIVAMAVSRPTIREGDIVRVTRRVDLDGGATIPHGYAAKVLEVDVIDGKPVVLVKGPAGSSHWISMKAVGGGGGGRTAPGRGARVLGFGVGGVLFAGAAYYLVGPTRASLLGTDYYGGGLHLRIGLAVVAGAVVLVGLKQSGRPIPSVFRSALLVAVVGYVLLIGVWLLEQGMSGRVLGYGLCAGLGAAAVITTWLGGPQAVAGAVAEDPVVLPEPPRRVERQRPPPAATFRMAPVDDTRQSFLGLDEPTRVPAPVAAPQNQVAAWLDDAAPADPFDFGNRRQLRYEVARIDARSPARRGTSPALGVAYDLASWFPMPEPEEARRAAYVLSVVLLDGSERPRDFAVRGKSTLLVTNQRLVGVCPEGESVQGPFRAETGNVAVWTMALDDIGPATVARSAATEHAIIRSRQTNQPWLLLAKPQQVVHGALQAVGLHDLVDLVNAAASQRLR